MYVFASGNIRWRATGFRSPLDKIKRVSNTRLVYTWIFPGNPPPFSSPLSFLSLFLSLFYSSVSLSDTNVLDKYEFIAALAWNVYSRRKRRKSSSPSVLQFLLTEGERTRIPIGIKRPSPKDFVRFQLIFIISPLPRPLPQISILDSWDQVLRGRGNSKKRIPIE